MTVTVKEAIKELKGLAKSTMSSKFKEVYLMAISALEKEKEQALQEAKTSSNKNFSIKNDNTNLKICQEVIDEVATKLSEYYRDQLSEGEQQAWELGEVNRKVLDAQDLLEEENK